MKILAIEKSVEIINEEKLSRLLIDEAKKVWELMQEGVIREIYFSQKDHCAVLIMECENEIEAGKILNTLPLVRENLITFEIKILIPYNGFERLFK